MNFAMAEMKVAVAMILKRYVLLTLSVRNEFLGGGGGGGTHIKRTKVLVSNFGKNP